jgi:hypothetical protein
MKRRKRNRDARGKRENVVHDDMNNAFYDAEETNKTNKETPFSKIQHIKENARSVVLTTLSNVSVIERVCRFLQLVAVAPFVIVLYVSLYFMLKIFPCLPFPSILPVGLKNAFGRGSIKDIVTTGTPDYKRFDVDGNELLEVKNMNWDFPWKQDNNIYWFGKGNVCSRMKKVTTMRKKIKNDVEVEVVDSYIMSDFFDSSKPSVIYIHGYSPGTTKRGFRETINWRENDKGLFHSTNTLDMWIDKGYNCGIFYWNSQADELDLKVAERKIYTEHGPGKMRYLLRGGDNCESYWYEAGVNTSNTESDSFMINDAPIAKQFYNHYCKHFTSMHCAPIHLVGHSLGCQIALESIKLMHNTINTTVPLPSRLALLDPFCSALRVNNFKSNLRNIVENINTNNNTESNIVIETYATSIIGEGFLISHTPVKLLKKLTYYSNINSNLIPWYSIKWRHICVIHYYFSSIVFDEHDVCNKDATWNEAIPHAGASLEMIRKRMRY